MEATSDVPGVRSLNDCTDPHLLGTTFIVYDAWSFWSFAEQQCLAGQDTEGIVMCPKDNGRACLTLISTIIALSAAATSARSHGVAEFYHGKNVNLIVGFSVGGGYDLYARVLAQHIGKHIPGNPTIVPQTMTGAGSLRAAQHIYNVAPKDGLTFGTFSRMVAIDTLIEEKVLFDSSKFSWLGSITNDVTTCVSLNSSAVKTYKHFLAIPSVFGAQAPGSEIDIFASLYKNVLGARVRLADGYPGTNIMLAMERGEVDGICGLAWTTIKAQRANWITEKKINVLVQNAAQRA